MHFVTCLHTHHLPISQQLLLTSYIPFFTVFLINHNSSFFPIKFFFSLFNHEPNTIKRMDAVVVGSQVTISATFSIISQCCALNRFARVKIVHTSQKKKPTQVYMLEVNQMFMCLCLVVMIGLRKTNMMSHAYGINLSYWRSVLIFCFFFYTGRVFMTEL